MEQSSRKRWREEISSVQFSGTPYGECGALHASAHTHSAEEEEEERASRALSQGFWSAGDFGPAGPKSPECGLIKWSGPGILVRALKSLSSCVCQRPSML